MNKNKLPRMNYQVKEIENRKETLRDRKDRVRLV